MGPSRSWQRARAATAGAAVIVAVSLVLAGCRITSSPDETTGNPNATPPTYLNETRSDAPPQRGGQLVYALPDDTNSWNPALAQWGSYSMTEARAIFDFLTTFDADGNVKPYLAESLTPSADYRSWTIKLRPGVTFTNGKPFDAHALVRIQQYIKASPILGETFEYFESWDILDDLTVVTHMNRPWASFAEGMASQVGAIADPDWLVQNDGINAVGTGAFKIEKWTIGSRMEMVRNPNYWRTDSWGNRFPYLDKLTFTIITDDSARAAALRNGDADVTLQSFATPDVTQLRAAGERGEYQFFSDSKFETAEDHVILNSASPPFNDPDARLALAYATDQVDYIKTITGGLNQPADSAYAPGSRWYNPIAYPTYDPAKAAELVAKVKTRNGGEFTFELMAQDTPNAQLVQQYLQTQWAKVGITARAVNVKQEAKIIATVIGSYQATVMQLFDSPSPDNDCYFWKPSGRPTGTASVNFSRVDDPELRQACLDLAGTSDFAARKVLVGKIQERIAKSVPYVWLAHTSRTVAANKRVTNLTHWTLPDGSAGLDFIQGSLSLYQVWMKS